MEVPRTGRSFRRSRRPSSRSRIRLHVLPSRLPSRADLEGRGPQRACYLETSIAKGRRASDSVLVDEKTHAMRSGRGRREPTFTGGSERQHGSDALRGEAWKVGQDLRFRHASGQVFQYVLDSDACTSNARLAAANSRRHRNQVFPAHGGQHKRFVLIRQANTTANAVQATRRHPSMDRSQASNWFQLTERRATNSKLVDQRPESASHPGYRTVPPRSLQDRGCNFPRPAGSRSRPLSQGCRGPGQYSSEGGTASPFPRLELRRTVKDAHSSRATLK